MNDEVPPRPSSSRGAQWALFALCVPGAFLLYIGFQAATGIDDELVIYRLFPIYAYVGLFGLTGLVCLWATSPARLSRLGRVIPSFPLPSLLLILPILVIPPLRRSTRLVRTAAINAAIWSALIAIGLVVRVFVVAGEIEDMDAEWAVSGAHESANTEILARDREARCRHFTEVVAEQRRLHPDSPLGDTTPPERCGPDFMRVETMLLEAGVHTAPDERATACRAACAALADLSHARPGLWIDPHDCAPCAQYATPP